eukprot:UN21690
MGVDWFSYTIPYTSFLIGLLLSTSGYNNSLGFCFVLFLTYQSVELHTKGLNDSCFRNASNFPSYMEV